MDAFLKAILQVGIFMVCAQAIVHFRPDGSYEKYLKMLVSAMILIQVFWPLAGLFLQGDVSLEERILFFQEELADGMREAEQITEWSDRILEEMTLEEVQRRMQEAQEAEAQQAQNAEAQQAQNTEAQQAQNAEAQQAQNAEAQQAQNAETQQAQNTETLHTEPQQSLQSPAGMEEPEKVNRISIDRIRIGREEGEEDENQ